MTLLIETSLGDIVIELFIDQTPISCENIIKLSKIKWFDNCKLFSVDRNYIAQFTCSDNLQKEEISIYGLLNGIQSRYSDLEPRPSLNHTNRGIVAMALKGNHNIECSFYITLSDSPLTSLDKKNTVVGRISEGFDTIERITELAVDEMCRPLQKVSIKKTIIIEDPFPDMPGLKECVKHITNRCKLLSTNLIKADRKTIKSYSHSDSTTDEIKRKEENNRANILNIIGDLPDAAVKPPKNVLFICKLNPLTTECSLELIFSQFGLIQHCEIIRDPKTGESLNYGFIGFESETSCERAFFKMNHAIIDERRIKVDFSQSVAYLWKSYQNLNSARKK